MRLLNRLRSLLGMKKVPETAFYVRTQEQADAINGFFHVLDENAFAEAAKIADPSYGRIVTLEFDISDPESKRILDYLKVISQFNGNGFADIKTGEYYATLEFATFEDAEVLRKSFIMYQENKKESAENKPENAEIEKDS